MCVEIGNKEQFESSCDIVTYLSLLNNDARICSIYKEKEIRILNVSDIASHLTNFEYFNVEPSQIPTARGFHALQKTRKESSQKNG